MLIVEVELPGRARPLTCRTDEADLAIGERLIVEQDGRPQFGTCSRVPVDLPWPDTAVLPRVQRRASENDEDRESHVQRQREEWLDIARQQVAALGLPMRLLRADPASGAARRVMISFIAEGRVDFRELVRDLARRLRARVELRQIGVRDGAVAQGGIGHCGQALCCASWMSTFAPVSMRMAKLQGLPLNPAKISGQCGRLMCCLRYELSGADSDGDGASSADANQGSRRGRCDGCKK